MKKFLTETRGGSWNRYCDFSTTNDAKNVFIVCLEDLVVENEAHAFRLHSLAGLAGFDVTIPGGSFSRLIRVEFLRSNLKREGGLMKVRDGLTQELVGVLVLTMNG